MKIIKIKDQGLKARQENQELKLKLSKQEAKTDYVAMMAGIEIDFKESENE